MRGFYGIFEEFKGKYRRKDGPSLFKKEFNLFFTQPVTFGKHFC